MQLQEVVESRISKLTEQIQTYQLAIERLQQQMKQDRSLLTTLDDLSERHRERLAELKLIMQDSANRTNTAAAAHTDGGRDEKITALKTEETDNGSNKQT